MYLGVDFYCVCAVLHIRLENKRIVRLGNIVGFDEFRQLARRFALRRPPNWRQLFGFRSQKTRHGRPTTNPVNGRNLVDHNALLLTTLVTTKDQFLLCILDFLDCLFRVTFRQFDSSGNVLLHLGLRIVPNSRQQQYGAQENV